MRKGYLSTPPPQPQPQRILSTAPFTMNPLRMNEPAPPKAKLLHIVTEIHKLQHR